MVNLIVSTLVVVLAAAPQAGEAAQAPAPLISLAPAGETQELRLKDGTPAGSASAQTLPERSPGSAHPLSDAFRAETARYAAAQGNGPSLLVGVRKGVFWTSVGLIASGLTLLTVDQGRWLWNGCDADPNDPDWQWLKELPPSTPPPGG